MPQKCSAPDTAWGAYSTLPDPIAGFDGGCFMPGKRKDGMEGVGRKWRGKG